MRAAELLGSTPVMHDLRRADREGRADASSRVLITGESGTGKELIARAHPPQLRASRTGPFVKVNCAAIPPELIESELFGHERGAFTGAVAQEARPFEVADGGTIFLDEIGDMALAAQAKVLRVLQTGEFTRVGGEKSLRTDCRVVAATNRDLEEMVKAGTFREDLFFRLNVVPIRSPDPAASAPTTSRCSSSRSCASAATRTASATSPSTSPCSSACKRYEWPGNVRELRNVVERLVIMSDEVIRERDLPPYLGGPRSSRRSRSARSRRRSPRSISAASPARASASFAKRSRASSSASGSPSSSGTSRAPRRRSASSARTCTRSCARSASIAARVRTEDLAVALLVIARVAAADGLADGLATNDPHAVADAVAAIEHSPASPDIALRRRSRVRGQARRSGARAAAINERLLREQPAAAVALAAERRAGELAACSARMVTHARARFRAARGRL